MRTFLSCGDLSLSAPGSARSLIPQNINFEGVLQVSGPDAALSFLSQHGRVDLDSLSALWLRILRGQLQETAAR
jgi:hypothetical protein